MEEKLTGFRTTRDHLEQQIKSWLNEEIAVAVMMISAYEASHVEKGRE